MSATLTFPCDRRYQTTLRDAVATAVMALGFDERRTAAAMAQVDPFLEGCLQASSPAISIEVNDARLTLQGGDRTLIVDI